MRQNRLRSLLLGEYTYLSLLDTVITVETPGAYGEAVAGLDRGDPLSVLDVIDAEQLLSLIDDDEAAKAAAALAMCGWKPGQLGGLFHPKLGGGRPGKRLLDDAAFLMSVRARQVARDAEKKREGLRA